ncbi:glycoside hydrolase family 2 TIM barrel-domain containing protein [Butyrivibrio sp. MC2021]|uniref:glycoside hydrolase family 2 TIM barrel-domain containing protein n=1 Tax=Butyrivibrio sp. MC2021 TaxID=1408306 RepID=UPI000478792F|nr:glycoside hydrolase family 2 TIM barrel-domain containing protein [Butyrivibrio sp. MC2021]
MVIDLAGVWEVKIEDEKYEVKIPGTLDESGIGGKDELLLKKEGREFVKAEGPIESRLTRKHFYMGEAAYCTKVSREAIEQIGENRVFLTVERSRALRLFVDGKEVEAISGTLATPYRFEVTGLLQEGSTIRLLCDNSYPDMPAANILYSSAATDETQTNWNGLLGKVGIEVFPKAFISGLWIYPKKEKVCVKATISSDREFKGILRLDSDAFKEAPEQAVELLKNSEVTVVFENIGINENALKWDEYEGNLYKCIAALIDENGKKLHEAASDFGIRDFGYDHEGRLTINGRRFFLRGEANCAEFPEEGHWPMDTGTWKSIMEKYKAYGLNCVRFHSHCPPEAAFEAADRAGIMVQPELSHWNPVDAFLPEHSFEYYKKELTEIITSYANHPSFVMLTLGNELHSTDEGVARMEELIKLARKADDTRLYAWGSNNFYGDKGANQKSDFYTGSDYRKTMLRATSAGMIGYLNREYPNSEHNFSEICSEIRKDYDKPIFGFEVGQYEILPDFDELEEFRGVSDPVNLRLVKEKAVAKGLVDDWKKYVEATGELALLCYREEVEAALRTPGMSGLSLLGIQDFPGQGTALVGMMNSHLEPKPFDFAKPERFREFFRAQLPLLQLPRYTYYLDEQVSGEIFIANYGRNDIKGKIEIEIIDDKTGTKLMHQTLESGEYKFGELSYGGKLGLRLPLLKKALLPVNPESEHGVCLRILVYIIGDDKEVISNSYNIWAYPRFTPERPASIYESKTFDDKAKKVLEEGGIVYLSPDSDAESLPHSIQAQFSTDFWSVGTFEFQEGGMGQYIDAEHPIFKHFPTKSHNQWQWWPMANGRAVMVREDIRPIIKELDSYSKLRPLAKLFECKCLKGRVLFSSMGLQQLQEYPEAKALLSAIYQYLDSEDFCPEKVLETADLEALFV